MFYVLESQNQPYRDVLCAWQYWVERLNYLAQEHETANAYSSNIDIIGFTSLSDKALTCNQVSVWPYQLAGR